MKSKEMTKKDIQEVFNRLGLQNHDEEKSFYYNLGVPVDVTDPQDFQTIISNSSGPSRSN